MWLKGDKTHPTFTYTLMEKGGEIGLLDEVTYLKKGKKKQIIGFDRPVDESHMKFIWRGKGLLSLLTSRWEILFFNPDEEWAIIHFEKTLFTPEGYDVISRENVLTSSQQKSIEAKLLELGLKDRLKQLDQQ